MTRYSPIWGSRIYTGGGMRRLPVKDPTLIQVLSLYLLLLAFFVLMFNASRFDRGRTDAVSESLASTFRMNGDPAKVAVVRSSDQGQAIGDELILDSFSDLIQTALPVARIENLRRGRLLRVSVGVGELFEGNSSALRGDRDKLLTELAKLLGKHPPGRRHKVEVFLTGQWVTLDRLTKAVPLPITRAAVISQSLMSGGALIGTVSGGVMEGPRREVVFLYRVDPEIRPEDLSGTGDDGTNG